MKDNLLITGASGFLGFHLIEAALSANYEVYAGVRTSSKVGHLQHMSARVLALDLSDIDGTREKLQQHGITYIIHAAALTKAKTEAEYHFSNALLTRNLALAAMSAHTGLKKLVFISSLAALGPAVIGEPVTEDTAPHPLTWYGQSKLLAEQYLREIPGLPFIGLRPTAVYGPREKDLLLLIQSVCKGFEIYIGSQRQQLSFVYVKDLAALAIQCLQSPVNGAFYNISDGKVYEKDAFAAAIKKITGRRTLRLQLPRGLISLVAGGMDRLYSRSSKTPVLNRDKLKELTAANWTCSIEKSRNELHYRPVYDLEKGMAETIEWYRKNNWV